MHATAWVVFVAAHFIVACCLFLVINRKYKDGFFGRIALVALGAGAAVFLVDGYADDLESVLPSTATCIGAVAVFLVRHAYRFVRFSRGIHEAH